MRAPGTVYVDPRTDDRTYRILVVDDEVEIATTVERLIARSLPNTQVTLAHDGAAGLAVLRGGKVDLVLTDHRMPGMTGSEMVTQLRKFSPDVPVIIMTAYADLDLAMRAMNEQGVAKLVMKPFEGSKLIDMIRGTLEKLRADELRGQAFQRVMDAVKG